MIWFFFSIIFLDKRNSKVLAVDGMIILLGWYTDLLVGQRKEHVVDAVLLHEVDSALIGEACEGWDTVDIMAW